MKLYIVPHSHIDVEWYWTAEDMAQMLPELFYDTTLPALEQDETLCFAQDQTVIWEKLLKHAPKQILSMVQAGRLEPVGGTYVQPEVQEPCGESYIRNLQLGQAWMQQNLGRRARCAWHTDAFGQISQLPQILRQAGFDSLAFMRDINRRDDPETFPTEFWLQGPDGSRILSHWFRISYVLCESSDPAHRLVVATVGGAKNEETELEYVFRQLLDKTSLQHQTGLALLPWGNDVYSLTLHSGQIKEKLMDAAKTVGLALSREDIIISTPSAFFDALRKQADLLAVKACDLTPPQYRQDLRGTYLSRVRLKQINRRAEQALLSYESLCACADTGAPDLDMLWKTVLFGQFHDTIGGSCIDEVYAAALKRNMAVIDTVTERKKTILGNRSGKVINLFNPTQFVREDTVTVPADAPVFVTSEKGEVLACCYDAEAKLLTFRAPVLAPYETASVYAQTGKAAVPESAETVENEFYRLHIDPVSGNPDSIRDKQAGRELLCGQGNVTAALEEKDPDMEGALHLTGACFTDEAAKAERITITKTPVAVTVETEKNFLGFRLKKTVSLPKGKKAVEFTVKILDYPGTDLIVRAQFPFAMKNGQSICETPFAVERGRTELFCAQKWAGLQENGYTVAILNEGNCAYWAEKNILSLGLLRAHSNFTAYAEYGTDRGLARFADGKTHTELAAERGCHRFSYTLVSGNIGIAALSAQALCRNTPLEAVWSDAPVSIASPIRAVTGDLIITSLSAAQAGIILRGYHASEQAAVCRIHMAKPVKKAQLVNLLDEVTASAAVEGSDILLPMKPFEIVTLHIN